MPTAPQRNSRERASRLARLLVGAIGLALLLTGCVATVRTSSVSDPRLHGTWHLASASDRGLGIPLAGQSITLTIGDAAHTGGDSPCSSYSASITGGVGVVYIRAQLNAGPRDDCATPQLNTIEKDYLDALISSRFAEVDEGSLILSSSHSNLVYVRAAPTPVVALRNSSWRLYALPTSNTSDTTGPGLNPVYLRFDGELGLTISSACATFAATYRLAGENFTVSAQKIVYGTPVTCTPADRTLAAEAAVLLDGPLLVDEASAGNGDPATLVITNLNENVPVVWRSAQ